MEIDLGLKIGKVEVHRKSVVHQKVQRKTKVYKLTTINQEMIKTIHLWGDHHQDQIQRKRKTSHYSERIQKVLSR